MASIATSEGLKSLFGTKAADKSSFLFPYLCGSVKDVEATDTIRNRYPIINVSKMGDFDGALSTRKTITKYVSVASDKKECHINLADAELREGSVVLDGAMTDMVNESLSYWDEKAIESLEDNGNAFDSVAFFSANHYINGTSGDKQSNVAASGTCAVVVATSPTVTEAASILDEGINKLYDMKDLNSKLVNQGMKEIIVVVGTATIANAFKQAVSKTAGAAPSANVNLGMSVTVKQASGITAGNVYILRGDATSRTIVMQETSPETRFTPSDAKDSDNWFTYTSERGVGLGVYYNAVLAQLTTK